MLTPTVMMIMMMMMIIIMMIMMMKMMMNRMMKIKIAITGLIFKLGSSDFVW